jgi:DNA-binding response OmpR family regulator/HD-like signal output (HDOD) protein
MANILLLDESEVAGRAMQGILARGNHACFTAHKAEDAWRMLREGVVFDVVFLELERNGSGAQFLSRLRDDWFWKILPVVVYTAVSEPKQVKRALALNIQNFLIKPYNGELIYAEIEKALRNPWRNLHFEEAKSFCTLMNLSADDLARMRREVMTGFDKAAQTFPEWAKNRQNEEVFAQITALATDAESAGIWGGVDYLRHLQEQAVMGNWSEFASCAEYLDFASRLIFCQLNPSFTPDSMHTEAQKLETSEAVERARWVNLDVDASGPVMDSANLLKQVDGLGGCPVIDTAAAAFQMFADGRAATMSQVMDLVASDPGLAVQILVAANKLEQDDLSSIDDVRTGASLLGEIKLNTLAKTLPVALERHMDLPPLTWPSYWTFQVAVGRVAQFVCTYLEFDYLKSNAYVAGLIHDLGKLLLLRLHPYGLQAIVSHAREKKLALADAERKFLGCTTQDLALHFATTCRLPAVYTHVIRWIDTPALATENMDLVAMVSLARHLCVQAHVGCSGEPARNAASPIASSPAWGVLQQRVFPSFDLKKFEAQSLAFCATLRSELTGQLQERKTLPAEAASLV